MAAESHLNFKAVVIGASAGGFQALRQVLAPLPEDFSVPILVVRHQRPDSSDYLIDVLRRECHLKVEYAQHDGVLPEGGTVYVAPPDRHLRIDEKGALRLSMDEPVKFSRPSIDPLFESAAEFYGPGLLAIVLSGANDDGAAGVAAVKRQGGRVMVQDPASADAATMPRAAMAAVEPDWVVWLDQIGPLLWTLMRTPLGTR